MLTLAALGAVACGEGGGGKESEAWDETDDETIEVRSAAEAEELGLDVDEYLESRALIASAPGAALLATVTCGGRTYTKQLAAGCSGSVCRTANTPTKCTSGTSPCAYYIGACVNGRYTDRLHHANDLYFKTGTPGNPTSTQGYWSLYTGSSLGNSQPIYYRAQPPQVAEGPSGADPGWPGWTASQLVKGTCPGGLNLTYYREYPATQSQGHTWLVNPANCGGRPCQYYRSSCSGGAMTPYANFTSLTYYDPSHGWHGNQPAMVLDLGPTGSGATAIYARPIPRWPAVDDPPDPPTCTPYPEPCTSSSQCCPGTACLNTSASYNQCCACLLVGNYCQSPAACASAHAAGEDVIWPGDPRFDASMAE
jgi:hypothetical protein